MQNVAALVYTGGRDFMHKGSSNACGKVAFVPMIQWVNNALEELGIEDRCYVRHEGEEDLEKFTGSSPVFVSPAEGGHPSLYAKDWVAENRDKDIVLLCAEAPFVNAKALCGALEHQRESDYNMTVLASGGRTAFIQELGISTFWIKGGFLSELFGSLKPEEDPKGLGLVAAAIKKLSEEAKTAGTFVVERKEINMRAETAEELHKLNNFARGLIFVALAERGVDIPCTDGVVIQPGIKIGAGTEILPGTIIRGDSEIGENCVIGPNSWIEDSKIGDGCEINSTQIRFSVLENEVKIGPFSQVRPGTTIHGGCKIGDYVEIKNSELGARTAVAHLTYIGDSDVGEGVNFGCGCCVANYDGQEKHRTKIGDHAFLGCNTNLIAPVELGNFAYTGAGSTITKDVPDYALAVGRAKQEIYEDWVKKHDAIKIK